MGGTQLRIFRFTFMNLFVLFLVSSILPIIVTGWIYYNNISSKLDQNLNIDTNSILSERIQSLSFYIYDLERMGDSIAGNATVSAFLESTDKSAYPYYAKLNAFINGVNAIRPENVGITIIANNGPIYNYGYSLNRNHDNFHSFNWFSVAENSNSPTEVTSVHMRPYSTSNPDRPVFSFVKTLYSFDFNAKGELIIDFDTTSLNHFFNVSPVLANEISSQGSGLFVTDNKGNVIYTSNNMTTEVQNNRSKYKFISKLDPLTGWTVTAYFSKINCFRQCIGCVDSLCFSFSSAL